MTRKSRFGTTSVISRYCVSAIFGICAALPGAALAQDWWVGIWAGDPEWCAVADQIGEVSPAPIEISETVIRGYENSCDIAKAREVGKVNAALLRLKCTGEGETYKEQRLILKQSEDAIWMWWGSDEPIQFTRCKG